MLRSSASRRDVQQRQLGANPAMLEQLLMQMFVPDTAQVCLPGRHFQQVHSVGRWLRELRVPENNTRFESFESTLLVARH